MKFGWCGWFRWWFMVEGLGGGDLGGWSVVGAVLKIWIVGHAIVWWWCGVMGWSSMVKVVVKFVQEFGWLG